MILQIREKRLVIEIWCFLITRQARFVRNHSLDNFIVVEKGVTGAHILFSLMLGC